MLRPTMPWSQHGLDSAQHVLPQSLWRGSTSCRVRYLDVQTSRLLLLFGRNGFNKSEGDGLESFLKSIIDDLKGKAVDAECDGMLIKEHTSAATNILNKSIPGQIQLASSDSIFASLVTHDFSGNMDLAEQLKESWQSVVGVSSSDNVDHSEYVRIILSLPFRRYA